VQIRKLQAAKYETSIAGWSFALADGLECYGIDPRPVFEAAGIDLDNVSSPDQRLPVSGVQKVWRHAEEHTDHFFGIHVSQFLTPASLHALGFALLCSSNLKDYFERYIRYRCVLSHMHFCELTEEEDCYKLSVVDERKVKSEITQDTAIGFFLRMARLTCSPDFAPRAVHITRTPGVETGKLEDFYRCELLTGCDEYALFLERDVMERRLRFANPQLARQQDALVERYISEMGLISEYMLRVRTEITRQLQHSAVNIEAVAASLNVTVRTLQRRLADERSSYNTLLDEARQQLAMEYARDPRISATEAAFKLGFNDSGSFGRSFRRWTGQSFTAYRHAVQTGRAPRQ
jgi:AraC-like DNA-binding protein